MNEFNQNGMDGTECEVDTVPISQDAHRQIVARISEANRRNAIEDRRADPRFRIEHEDLVLLEIYDIEGVKSTFKVKLRNISEGGVAFLHGQDVPAGALCKLTIVSANGDGVQVEGRVVRSRNVLGGVYEIGAQFDQRISLEGILDAADRPSDRRIS